MYFGGVAGAAEPAGRSSWRMPIPAGSPMWTGALETRLKLLEGEVRGQIDLSQFGKPELLQDMPEE